MLILILQYGVYWCMYRNVVLDCMFDTSVQSDSGVGQLVPILRQEVGSQPSSQPNLQEAVVEFERSIKSQVPSETERLLQRMGWEAKSVGISFVGFKHHPPASHWCTVYRANSVKFDGALTVQNMPILHLSSMVTCNMVGKNPHKPWNFRGYTQIPFPQLQRHSLKPPHHGHRGHHSRCRQSPRAGRRHREQCKVGQIDILWARRSGVMTNDFLGNYLCIFHSPGHSDIRTYSEEIQIFLVSQWFESWFSLVVYHSRFACLPPRWCNIRTLQTAGASWGWDLEGSFMEPGMLDVGLAGMTGFTKSMFLFYIYYLGWYLVMRK